MFEFEFPTKTALNMNLDVDSQVNLQERWRELNAYIVRKCTDKSNPYL
jgi:hypothetical protein